MEIVAELQKVYAIAFSAALADDLLHILTYSRAIMAAGLIWSHISTDTEPTTIQFYFIMDLWEFPFHLPFDTR